MPFTHFLLMCTYTYSLDSIFWFYSTTNKWMYLKRKLWNWKLIPKQIVIYTNNIMCVSLLLPFIMRVIPSSFHFISIFIMFDFVFFFCYSVGTHISSKQLRRYLAFLLMRHNLSMCHYISFIGWFFLFCSLFLSFFVVFYSLTRTDFLLVVERICGS